MNHTMFMPDGWCTTWNSRAVQDAISETMILADHEGAVRLVNLAAEGMQGPPPESPCSFVAHLPRWILLSVTSSANKTLLLQF